MKNLSGILSQQPLFKNLFARHIEKIAQFANEASFEAGEILLKENAPASHFFLIQEGEVALESASRGAGYFTVQTVKAGESVGWSWLFVPYMNHFQARAAEPVRAIKVDGAALLVHCETDHDLGHALMKCVVPTLVARLQEARKRIVELSAINP
ncbi:MAG TPA: Crp/Fnr family transcriptional regulator [Methylomirabilota bacterium]|nr:Crp/Fnr family transcriptional regulator [Methylomirabilota bacterium]